MYINCIDKIFYKIYDEFLFINEKHKYLIYFSLLNYSLFLSSFPRHYEMQITHSKHWAKWAEENKNITKKNRNNMRGRRKFGRINYLNIYKLIWFKNATSRIKIPYKNRLSEAPSNASVSLYFDGHQTIVRKYIKIHYTVNSFTKLLILVKELKYGTLYSG